jgi:uncharacterized protein YfaS (alpha-2-macroglobulin family)
MHLAWAVSGRGFLSRLVLALSVSALLAAAAGWEAQPVPAATPGATAILGWSPGVGRNVPLTTPLTVYFNRAMDRLSVERAWSISPAVAGSFQWSDASVSFRPARPLAAGLTYRVSIGTAAQSTTGVPLAQPFAVQFSTGDALRVTSYSPWNGTRGVPASGLISITFNHPMVPLAGLSAPPAHPRGWSVSITPHLAGHGSWLGTSTWVFHPDGSLQPSTRYTVTLGSGAQDAWGQPLGRSLRWSFSTLTPEVVSRSPHNDALYVDPRAPVSVTFNQPMDHAATAAALSVSFGGTRVAGSFRWKGTTLVFHPASPLGSSHPYEVTLARSARSANGRATLPRAVQWQFRASPLPKVTGTSPGLQKTAYAGGPSGGYSPICCYPYTVRIYFNAPMDKSSLDKRLSITPSVQRFSTWFSGPDQNGIFTYSISGGFDPSASYTVTLAPGAQDRFGRPLSGGFAFPFTTSRLYPSVSLYGMPGTPGIAFSAGQVKQAPIQFVNIPRVTYTLIRTNLYGLASMGNGPPSGTRVRHWTETIPSPLNAVQNQSVSLAQSDGSPLPPGLYWLDARAPAKVPGWPAFTYPPESGELVVVSNVSLTVKQGGNGTLVWVSSAQTGKPLAGVPVRLTDYQGVTLASGKTDTRGLHLFTRFTNTGRLYAAVVADGTYYSMTTLYWQPRVSSPSYLPDFWAAYWGGSPSFGTYLYTDRAVYRPGQRVHFRGVLWRDQDAVYSLLGPMRAAVKAVDPYGHVVYQATVTLDRFGAVHGSFSLPGNTPTGSDFIYVNIPRGAGVSAGFDVAEYRKPEFLTSVTSEKPSYVQGQTLTATAAVKYVFGAPVIGQTVSWVAYAQPEYTRPPGWDDYSFLDWEQLWQQNVSSSGGSQFGQEIGSGTGTTDGQGHLTIHLPVSLAGQHFDQTLTVEATATDVNHQSVSGRVAVSEYRSDVIVGLAAEHQTQPVGQSQTVEVAAVKNDGTPVAGQTLTATVYRRTYSSKLVETGNHTTDWRAVPHDTVVETHSLTSDSKGKATLSFVPSQGGEYYIVVQGKDELGNPTRNAISVYASAAGFTDWGLSSDTSINLKPDRSTYTVGQTAHITVPSPFDNATALITVERGTIRSTRVEQLASNSSTVDIPITLDDIPNIYVTVTLYRGWRSGSPPDWRYGLAELHVKVDPRHLVVHLWQNGFRHHPGDTVTYSVTTTDAQGKPVSAELSLALVDTSVLALEDERNPDILKALYSEQPLRVSTASDGVLSIDHLTEQPNFQLAPAGNIHGAPAYGVNAPVAAPAAPKTGGGGGGGAPPLTVRSHFADTAYWTGGLVTDAAGHGTVKIRLPDNATTWRLDARGVTVDQEVGQGQLQTLATQDLVLRPVLPRFFIEGDHLQVGTVLNNNLDRAISARVTITAHGLRLPSGAGRTAQIPAHGEQLFTWTAGVPQGRSASILVQARSLTDGVRGDAVRVQVPVHPPLTDEMVATAGQVYGSTQQVVIVPRDAVPVPGALTVQVSSSLTAGLGAAYSQFRASLNESNEDVANRLLVSASLRTLPQPVTGLPAKTYRRLGLTAALAVQKLLDRQYGDGGWPWFDSPYVYWSDPSITADALQALAASGEHSAQVRQSMSRARAFLLGQLTVVPAALRAHLLLVLAASGPAPRAQSEGLYADSIHRSHLDAAPLADLGLSLSMARDSVRARSIVSSLDSSAKVSATGAHWESAGWNPWVGPAVENTSEVVATLLRLSPHDPFVPAAVRWLMLARQGSGWDCPHDTAQAIASLAAYARAAREGTADYQYQVLLNGATKISGRYTASNARRVAAVKVPVSHLRRTSPNMLVLGRVPQNGTFGPGPLYYLARLQYYLRADAIPARSEGVSVSRRYLDLGGHPISRIAAGSPIKVELTIHSDQGLMYLNVQDPLPAGVEPIDESLNTSQRGLFGPTSYWLPFGPTSDLSLFLMHTDLHDNRVSLYSYYLPPGTFRYTYLAQATVPGRYSVPPTHASETFFPEVFGRSAGQALTVS